uniref:Big defensin-like n=1 Tax=Crassostrea virginica TaxID=6565 RepID=A0A8B8CXJ7_CRAVI|nr:big defensin-like [Crassostrea virginica]
MNKKSCICLFYIALLVLPAPILAKVRAEKDRKKRQALAAPLVGLAGATVGPALFALLVATYGVYKIASLGIKTDRDSHECDIGYCRAKCNSWEYVDWGLTTGCGDYYCCVQR